MNNRFPLLLLACSLLLPAAAVEASGKTAQIHADTPQPRRFVVQETRLLDNASGKPVFFRGMGYSPYLKGETPQQGAGPGNDGRYPGHLDLLKGMGVNYLHVFPLRMPANFFAALDGTDLVYGQDIWIDPFSPDILDEKYQSDTLASIKQVIDHTYATGRPGRLVLFSVGDELQAATVENTNKRHPEVRDYRGKHLSVTGRTASEVALARLIDEAMDYELTRYGQRHLYCHTSWTHIGPLADRPDLDIPREHVLVPDMGDLYCMNIYTYAHGVMSSPPGSVTGTPFQGYLEELAAGSAKPILVTQVGLSTSPIMPKPEVVDYGGRDVAKIPAVFESVWRDIRTARDRERFGGLVFFEFQDEWWKIGWVPGDENQHEPADPEEWFGIYEIGEDNRLIPKGEIPATLRNLFGEP
ncbi:MAG: hypothetical protein A2286_00540 [Gammaproteobacteria bacterium RIFOXYA12_FULL_61_12]|nr:MAG: hypothetical protein A2514_08655 [Gammaproteobacteria bacterium RIFOXYD12_FULL_61_37]OGT94102.1 MAG: hypothetical protein A2286_00540 [Gammaproteobacteria bacterium RIFOXYA12_FULL_61_12]